MSSLSPPSMQVLYLDPETKDLSVMVTITGTITHPVNLLKTPEDFDDRVHEASTQGQVTIQGDS